MLYMSEHHLLKVTLPDWRILFRRIAWEEGILKPWTNHQFRA